ncbi:MAG TPA: hypothetical protein ENJ82_08480 [Bacteroidetes bacterium]|nr:hypothetical protein [Bacteroidota bacterium]
MKIFSRILLFIILCGTVAACGPKSNLKGWLNRKGGRWEIKGGLFHEITYASSIDSTIRDNEPITGAGFFAFNKDETGSYAFNMKGFTWEGSFTYDPHKEFMQATATQTKPRFNNPIVSFSAFDIDRQTAHVNYRYDDVLQSGNRFVVLASIDLKRLED